MNTSEPITLAERLQRAPLGRLCVRLSLARTTLAYAATSFQRAKAIAEISAIRDELLRRGEKVAAMGAE